MDRPIQLITIDNNGRCGLTKEAEDIILDIKENIAVICVAGLYRTGKSYLLNRLLNRQDGFEIGPTINSCTKGLWMWGEPIFFENKNMKVILIDTEGLGSAFEDRNETIDMEIFCLGLLLSSLFIYNSMKNIDENAIEALSMVINFAKKIQASSQEVDSYSNNFPSLLWVLRDFALELIDKDGKKITSNQYLENALKDLEEDSDPNTISKNEIRKYLKLFFRDRDCETLIRPVSDEKKLRNIDKLQKSELRPDFIVQMDSLVKKIFLNVRPKVVQGSFLNGKMYLNLIKLYISAINNNCIPDVKTSWKIVIDSQMDKLYEKAFNYYTEEMLAYDLKKVNKLEDLLNYHNEHKSIALDYLKEFQNINIPLGVYLELIKKLETKINEQFKDCIEKWNEVSVKTSKSISEQIIKEYKNNNLSSDVYACLDLVEDVFKFIDDSVPNIRKYDIIYPEIVDFFVKFMKKGYKENKSKFENEINTLKHEKNVLQGIIDKTKDILDKTRDEHEEQIKELKEQLLSSRLELESKLEEKTRMIKNAEYSHENTVEEMKSKILMLSSIIENKKVNESGKKPSKIKPQDEGNFLFYFIGVLDLKLDNILERLDDFRGLLIKTELEKTKSQLKLEMNTKIEEVESDFFKKLNLTKKACEKAILKLKTSYNEEVASLKNLIKDLYDEINDFKCQVSSQEYKIELYKEKIIAYEKEKKSQTDHAELLKVLTTKLNNYIEHIGKTKY